MTAEQITAAMQHEGFKTGPVTAYTATTDPNHLLGRQGDYTSKTEWGGSDGSHFNSIEVYPDAAGAAKRVQLLGAFEGTFLGDGYDYLNGADILRLSSLMTPGQAQLTDADFRAAASG
jgi:hypothetical protein